MTTRNSSATVLILRARAKALNSRANRSVSGGRSFMSSANMVSGSRDGFCTNFFSFGEVVITMCRMPSFVISFQRAYGYPGAHGTGSGSDRVPSDSPSNGRRPVATAPGTVPPRVPMFLVRFSSTCTGRDIFLPHVFQSWRLRRKNQVWGQLDARDDAKLLPSFVPTLTRTTKELELYFGFNV